MLNFAFVGCGSMAHWHAQQLQKINRVKVVAVVDPVAQHARHFKEKYFHAAAEFKSLDDLLAKPPGKLDAVVLMTPHARHFPQAKAALEHGLHVLIEKPMVTRSEDAYDLWKLVKKSGKLLGITFQAPYTPEFAYLARQRDAGKLGKVQVISGWLSQGWLAATVKTWRQDPAVSGGGQMYDSGAHLLNAIMWLMNEPVVEVGCFYDRCGSPVDVNGVAVARFKNGALASIAIGGNCPTFRSEIQIQTDTMLILTDQYGGKLDMTGKEGHRITPKPDEIRHPVSPATLATSAARTPHANFVHAILGEEPLRAPVRYGVLLSALMDAMYESGGSGKLVKVKAVPEEI
jgi:predicted dehydrogenase